MASEGRWWGAGLGNAGLSAQRLDVFRNSSKWHRSLPTCPAGKASMRLTQSVDLNKARAGGERRSAIRRGSSVLWAAVGVTSLSEAHHARPCPGPLCERMLQMCSRMVKAFPASAKGQQSPIAKFFHLFGQHRCLNSTYRNLSPGALCLESSRHQRHLSMAGPGGSGPHPRPDRAALAALHSPPQPREVSEAPRALQAQGLVGYTPLRCKAPVRRAGLSQLRHPSAWHEQMLPNPNRNTQT